MTVRWRGSVRRERPRRKRAPPTPPASTVIRLGTVHPPVERRTLDGPPAHRPHERLDLLGRRVLPGVGAGLAGDALLHERAAEVVAAGAQRELREPVAELHPRGLDVVDHAAEHEAARGVDAEIAPSLGLRLDLAVLVETRVLPDEAERHELREAVRLLLEIPEQADVPCDVPRALDVAVHDGRRGGYAEPVRRGDDLDPRAHVDLLVR